MKPTAFKLLVVVALAAANAQAAMYRWVDANGKVHYSDTLPSNYQQRGSAELNKQGRVVGRTQSEAERRAEAARLAEESALKKAADEQARRDKVLLSTYTNESEIELARDRALEHYRAAQTGNESRARAVNANVSQLAARITALEKSGKTVSSNLRDQIKRVQQEQRDLKRLRAENDKAMLDLQEKYALEKLRFRELSARNP